MPLILLHQKRKKMFVVKSRDGRKISDFNELNYFLPSPVNWNSLIIFVLFFALFTKVVSVGIFQVKIWEWMAMTESGDSVFR